MALKNIPTADLINELVSREGVKKLNIESDQLKKYTGERCILTVQDDISVEWRRFIPLKENLQPLIELCEAKSLSKDDLELIVNSIAHAE